MDLKAAETKRKIQIAEHEEWREKAYHSAKLYKERTQRWHDRRIKIKQFKPGDKVHLFNSHVHLFDHGKLRSKWEGPYLVLHTTDHGAVTLQCADGDTFKANGQRHKLFLKQGLKSKRGETSFEKLHVLKKTRMRFTNCWERFYQKKKRKKITFSYSAKSDV
jgi:hypothetical protein